MSDAPCKSDKIRVMSKDRLWPVGPVVGGRDTSRIESSTSNTPFHGITDPQRRYTKKEAARRRKL